MCLHFYDVPEFKRLPFANESTKNKTKPFYLLCVCVVILNFCCCFFFLSFFLFVYQTKMAIHEH